MYRPYVRAIKPRDAKEVFGKTSQSNQFQVTFNGIPGGLTSHLRSKFNVNNPVYFMGSKGNLLCSDASLPASSLATQQIDNDFIGVSQEFAHKRLYTDIDFTYMIDYDYTILRIFEGWIDYISSGSETLDGLSETTDNYYRRMRYPDSYKSQSMFVTKFEKDFQYRIDYQFYNIFPKMMTAVPLSYGGAEVLKLTVSFNYDRYIVNPRKTISRGQGILPGDQYTRSGDFTDKFIGENGLWEWGSMQSLEIAGKSMSEIYSMRDFEGFNLDPQMTKGLTSRQIKGQFAGAASWTSTGGISYGGKIGDANNLNYRINENAIPSLMGRDTRTKFAGSSNSENTGGTGTSGRGDV